MTSLESDIRRSIADGSWSLSRHGGERLRQRRLASWQIAAGSDAGETIAVDPDAKPNPKVMIRATLTDGTNVIAVWAWYESLRRAVLVTAYVLKDLE